MGLAKNRQLEIDSLRQLAIPILKRTGAVSECEPHEVLLDEYDPEALVEAYKVANAGISDGTIELPAWFSRRDFTDLMKEIAGEAADECPICARNREE